MKSKRIFFGWLFITCTFFLYSQEEKDSLSIDKTNIAIFFENMVNEKFFIREHFSPVTITPVSYNDSILIERIKYLNHYSPFEYRYNADVRRWIDFYLSKPYFVARLIGLSKLYYPLFEETLDKYNLPLELKHLAVIESALNPLAKSRAGAAGLWQFMYKTGIPYDLNVSSYVDDRFDPIKATDAAARHLRDLYSIYKDWALVLAAYNAGPAYINRAILRANGETNYWKIKHFLPRETQQYVPAFIAASYVMTFYKEHGVSSDQPLYTDKDVDTITIREKVPFSLLSYFLGIDEDDLAFLNPQYIKRVVPGSTEKPCVLRIPRRISLTFVSRENLLYDTIAKLKANDSSIIDTFKPNKQTLNASLPPMGKKQIHVVAPGESLGIIAKKYRVTINQIKAWNNLSSNYIYPNQRLIIYSSYVPPALNTSNNKDLNQKSLTSSTTKTSSTTSSTQNKIIYHTVKQGETLWGIAQQYGISMEEIKKINNLKSDALQIGQALKIIKP